MDSHRTQKPVGAPQVYSFDCPGFSSFRYIKKNFPDASRPVHRAFSLARTMSCHVMVQEEITAVELLAEDNEEIARLGGVSDEHIYRVSFWKTPYVNSLRADDLSAEDMLGYIILKHDIKTPDKHGQQLIKRWYVFEGVFKQEKSSAICVPWVSTYRVSVGSKTHEIVGVLYCQQNGINKCCAHVAMRSIIVTSR